jgi:1,2-diacylglycerol 3-alpha-glucosyltransferase
LKIVHVCLSCFYIDGFGYQENELVQQHVKAGHKVTVIASTETYNIDRCLTYVQPSIYMGGDGAQVIRLRYRKLLPVAIMKKLRMHPGVRDLLNQIRPDAILFHGLCGWELHAVAQYKHENPNVRLYVDSHEDHNNSARTFVSKNVLHRMYYAWIIRRCIPDIDKILCISLDTIEFVKETYGLPELMLEFYPLGGIVFDDNEYQQRHDRGRRVIEIEETSVMLLQTGKMGRRKKILESLDAFTKTKGTNLCFVLVGSFEQDILAEAMTKIAGDRRIHYLKWKSTEQLKDLLCAADVYVQPGTQSATMQMSLGARCPVVLADVLSHQPFVQENGWLIRNISDLPTIFSQIRDHPERLKQMSLKSLAIAKNLLDYRLLANRVLQ